MYLPNSMFFLFFSCSSLSIALSQFILNSYPTYTQQGFILCGGGILSLGYTYLLKKYPNESK